MAGLHLGKLLIISSGASHFAFVISGDCLPWEACAINNWAILFFEGNFNRMSLTEIFFLGVRGVNIIYPSVEFNCQYCFDLYFLYVAVIKYFAWAFVCDNSRVFAFKSFMPSFVSIINCIMKPIFHSPMNYFRWEQEWLSRTRFLPNILIWLSWIIRLVYGAMVVQKFLRLNCHLSSCA